MCIVADVFSRHHIIEFRLYFVISLEGVISSMDRWDTIRTQNSGASLHASISLVMQHFVSFSFNSSITVCSVYLPSQSNYLYLYLSIPNPQLSLLSFYQDISTSTNTSNRICSIVPSSSSGARGIRDATKPSFPLVQVSRVSRLSTVRRSALYRCMPTCFCAIGSRFIGCDYRSFTWASTGVRVGVECILVERTCRNVEYLYSFEIWSIRS